MVKSKNIRCDFQKELITNMKMMLNFSHLLRALYNKTNLRFSSLLFSKVKFLLIVNISTYLILNGQNEIH